MPLTVADLWSSMGPLARAVMVLLVGMSVTSIAVAVDKWLRLVRAARDSHRFLVAWRDDLGRDGLLAAARRAERYPRNATAELVERGTRVLAATLDPAERREAYDRTVRRVIRRTVGHARQGLGVLATVGSTAPFVGLFGTVVGIVNAFGQMSRTGQGGLAVVSAGIAEALVATALGIGVAIPALWLYNYLTQRVGRLAAELESVADELAVVALGGAQPLRRAAGQAHVA